MRQHLDNAIETQFYSVSTIMVHEAHREALELLILIAEDRDPEVEGWGSALDSWFANFGTSLFHDYQTGSKSAGRVLAVYYTMMARDCLSY